MMSRKESWRWILKGPLPQPRRWSPLGSTIDPQGHKGAGSEGKVGRPSQILTAAMNSHEGIERPKPGMGGGLSQLLVSLLPTRPESLALP